MSILEPGIVVIWADGRVDISKFTFSESNMYQARNEAIAWAIECLTRVRGESSTGGCFEGEK